MSKRKKGPVTEYMSENFADLAKYANQLNLNKHATGKETIELIEDELLRISKLVKDKHLNNLTDIYDTLKQVK